MQNTTKLAGAIAAIAGALQDLEPEMREKVIQAALLVCPATPTAPARKKRSDAGTSRSLPLLGTKMNASLFVIHQTLQDLEDLRATVEAEGDSEAVAAIDQQIKEWLTADAVKVTSYVALIRSREATVAAAKEERSRIDSILKAAQADVDRLKANALATMQAFNVKELKATPGGGLRRQSNGGVEALELDMQLPTEFRLITVTMPEPQWINIADEVSYAVDITVTANKSKIREALKQRVVCDKCAGKGETYMPNEDNEMVLVTCEKCEGKGTVPVTIPGARLLPRGEQVRII